VPISTHPGSQINESIVGEKVGEVVGLFVGSNVGL